MSKLFRKVFAPEERVKNIRDRRVSPGAWLGCRLEDSIARDPRRKPAYQERQGGAARAKHAGQAIFADAFAIVAIAAENFIGSFTGKNDRYIFSGVLRKEHGRQRRLIAEGLVKDFAPSVEGRQDLLRAQHQAVMVTADVTRDARGLLVLTADVVTPEAQGEGIERTAGDPRRERRDQAGIDTAADEDTEWHIGDQHRLDGRGQSGGKRVDRGRSLKRVLWC